MRRHKLLFCSILVLCALGLPALAQAADTQISDMAGRKVTAPVGPERILCLGPGCLRLIVYLGAVDRVVGVERFERRMGGRPYYLAHRQYLDSLPVVSPGGPSAINKKPDLEKVLAARPQVIFVTMMQAGLADRVQTLLKVPVVVLDYGVVGGFSPKIYQSLLVAGKVLGKEDRARRVATYIEKGRGELARRAKGLAEDSPTAYVGGVSFKGFHGIDSTNLQYVPFRWLGVNTAVRPKTKRAYFFVDREELLRLQPEIIFLDAAGMQIIKTNYAKRPDYFQALKAFQQDRVYTLYPYNWYSTNLGTALADAFCVGRVVFPKGFTDIDPARKADEIYQFMVGKAVYEQMARLYGPLGAKARFDK